MLEGKGHLSRNRAPIGTGFRYRSRSPCSLPLPGSRIRGPSSNVGHGKYLDENAQAVRTRLLGRSDLEVSVLGLGTNNFGTRLDLDAAAAVLDECQEQGINFLDTADVYADGRSEQFLGQLLSGRRDDFIVATKVGMPWDDGSRQGGLDPTYIRKGVSESLQRLNTDHIDLLQLHLLDSRVPVDDVLEVLGEQRIDLISQGTGRRYAQPGEMLADPR